MGKAERKILCILPPTQGGGIGHQGEVPNGLHATCRGSARFYSVDQAGELLSWIGGSTGPPP